MAQPEIDPRLFVSRPRSAPARLVVSTWMLIGLAACGQEAAAPESPSASRAALTPELQAIYERSCKSCHTLPASGAPQTGDHTAWAPRVAQGAALLLEHTIKGYKAMPPGGTCMDCTPEQYATLIEYMAGATP